WTREHVLWNIEDSLEKLRSDAVDLLQLHNATVADVEKGGLVEVLREIKAAGKARWIGASSVSPHLETFIEWGVFDVFQVPYTPKPNAASTQPRTDAQFVDRALALGTVQTLQSDKRRTQATGGLRRSGLDGPQGLRCDFALRIGQA